MSAHSFEVNQPIRSSKPTEQPDLQRAHPGQPNPAAVTSNTPQPPGYTFNKHLSPTAFVHARVVPIPTSEHAADTFENAGADIGEYASLCTNHKPCNLLTAKLYPATFKLSQIALTHVTYLKLFCLCCSKTVLRKLCCAATDN